MNALRTASLLLATMSTGLMAGVFGLYAHTIMPGLAKTDDRTFVGAFHSIDRAIINPWFLGGGFIGAFITTVVAAGTHLGQENVGWVLAALALYLVAFIVTIAVHLPLNDTLKAAGTPDGTADIASVRESFNERKWRNWNVLRAWTCTAAFAILCWALVLHDRAG